MTAGKENEGSLLFPKTSTTKVILEPFRPPKNRFETVGHFSLYRSSPIDRGEPTQYSIRGNESTEDMLFMETWGNDPLVNMYRERFAPLDRFLTAVNTFHATVEPDEEDQPDDTYRLGLLFPEAMAWWAYGPPITEEALQEVAVLSREKLGASPETSFSLFRIESPDGDFVYMGKEGKIGFVSSPQEMQPSSTRRALADFFAELYPDLTEEVLIRLFSHIPGVK